MAKRPLKLRLLKLLQLLLLSKPLLLLPRLLLLLLLPKLLQLLLLKLPLLLQSKHQPFRLQKSPAQPGFFLCSRPTHPITNFG